MQPNREGGIYIYIHKLNPTQYSDLMIHWYFNSYSQQLENLLKKFSLFKNLVVSVGDVFLNTFLSCTPSISYQCACPLTLYSFRYIAWCVQIEHNNCINEGKSEILMPIISTSRSSYEVLPGMLFSWQRVMAVMSITDSSFEITSW